MGFNKLNLIVVGLVVLNVGCGYSSREVHRAGKAKTSKTTQTHQVKSGDYNVPMAELPPPITTEEIRKANADYAPTDFVNTPKGIVVSFRNSFIIDKTKINYVVGTGFLNADVQDPVIIYVSLPKQYKGEPKELRGLSLKVIGPEAYGTSEKPRRVRAVVLDHRAQDGETSLELSFNCYFQGNLVAPRVTMKQREFLSRNCTIDEFREGLIRAGALVLDYDDAP